MLRGKSIFLFWLPNSQSDGDRNKWESPCNEMRNSIQIIPHTRTRQLLGMSFTKAMWPFFTPRQESSTGDRMNFGLESSFLGLMQTVILIWCAWPARERFLCFQLLQIYSLLDGLPTHLWRGHINAIAIGWSGNLWRRCIGQPPKHRWGGFSKQYLVSRCLLLISFYLVMSADVCGGVGLFHQIPMHFIKSLGAFRLGIVRTISIALCSFSLSDPFFTQ